VSKPQPEIRTWRNLEFRVSAENEPSKISGYGAVFDSPSEDLGWFSEMREEIDPHAFDSVMASNPDVRGLFNHDSNLVLGRTAAGTLRLSVDARGLSYEIDPPDTQFARDLMVSMRRKDITGSSFAFTVKRDQWTDNPDGSITRRILEFDQLYDVSPVTYPAYPASSSEARSLPASCPAEMRSKLEARTARPEARANATGCQCACPECADNNCADCSDANCVDGECACQQDRSLRNADANRRLALRVAMNL
jgi:uncharacterized protein